MENGIIFVNNSDKINWWFVDDVFFVKVDKGLRNFDGV